LEEEYREAANGFCKLTERGDNIGQNRLEVVFVLIEDYIKQDRLSRDNPIFN
jgi:hypothetical protein